MITYRLVRCPHCGTTRLTRTRKMRCQCRRRSKPQIYAKITQWIN